MDILLLASDRIRNTILVKNILDFIYIVLVETDQPIKEQIRHWTDDKTCEVGCNSCSHYCRQRERISKRGCLTAELDQPVASHKQVNARRSEERRVGEEC